MLVLFDFKVQLLHRSCCICVFTSCSVSVQRPYGGLPGRSLACTSYPLPRLLCVSLRGLLSILKANFLNKSATVTATEQKLNNNKQKLNKLNTQNIDHQTALQQSSALSLQLLLLCLDLYPSCSHNICTREERTFVFFSTEIYINFLPCEKQQN